MYEYRWGMTAAQVELMSADAPFVAYKKREKTKEEKLASYTREQAERDRRRYEERKKKRKVNFATFLGNGNLDGAKSLSETTSSQ